MLLFILKKTSVSGSMMNPAETPATRRMLMPATALERVLLRFLIIIGPFPYTDF
jgi:hypothetical protein